MARNSLGSLIVTLGLDASQYVSGLTKAEFEAKKTVEKMRKQFGTVGQNFKSGLGAQLGTLFSVTAVALWTKSVLDAAEALQDLHEETGSSVESLSRLSNIAAVQGTSLDRFRSTLEKFTANLGNSADEASAFAIAMRTLGVTSKDPVVAFEQLAKALDKYADGATKAAYVKIALGKAGVTELSTLKALANETEIQATRTAEQIKAADDLREALRKLSNQSQTLANALLTDVVPGLNKVINVMALATREAGGFFAALNVLQFKLFTNDLQETEQALAGVRQELARAKEKAAGPAGFIDTLLGGGDEAVKRLQTQERILEARRNQFTKPIRGLTPDKPQLPPPPDPGKEAAGAREREAITKRLVDAQIKELERGIAAEKDILDARNEAIKNAYADGQLSVQNAFALEQMAREEHLQEVIANFDKQIEAQKRFRATLKQESDRIEVSTKIDELEDKKRDAIIDTAKASATASRQMVLDLRSYAAQVNEVNAKLAEMGGNLAKAAEIRFKAQTGLLRAQAVASGDAATAAGIDAIGRQDQALAKLNESTREYRGTLEDIGIARARIELQEQARSITETQAIVARQNLALEYIDVLNKQIDAQEEIAKTLVGPEREAAIREIKRMRLEVDALAESANELANKFNDAFAGPFADALSDVITGTKSLKDAFNDMTKSIVRNITDMVSKDLAGALFGKEGALGGIGKTLAEVFGGGKTILGGGVKTGGAGGGIFPEQQAAAAAATTLATTTLTADAALATLGLTTTAADVTMVTLTASATAAAAALAAVAATSTASAAGDLAGFFGSAVGGMAQGGGLAGGTDNWRGGPTWVGERGPEIVNLPKGAQVIPNSALQQKRAERTSVNIYQSFAPGTDRKTVGQAAAAAGKAVRRGLERYG